MRSTIEHTEKLVSLLDALTPCADEEKRIERSVIIEEIGDYVTENAREIEFLFSQDLVDEYYSESIFVYVDAMLTNISLRERAEIHKILIYGLIEKFSQDGKPLTQDHRVEVLTRILDTIIGYDDSVDDFICRVTYEAYSLDELREVYNEFNDEEIVDLLSLSSLNARKCGVDVCNILLVTDIVGIESSDRDAGEVGSLFGDENLSYLSGNNGVFMMNRILSSGFANIDTIVSKLVEDKEFFEAVFSPKSIAMLLARKEEVSMLLGMIIEDFKVQLDRFDDSERFSGVFALDLSEYSYDSSSSLSSSSSILPTSSTISTGTELSLYSASVDSSQMREIMEGAAALRLRAEQARDNYAIGF